MHALMLLALLALPQDDPKQEEVFSGPQVGEKISDFVVVDVNGPHREKEHNYIKDFNGAPTLLVFIHELTRPSAQCFRSLDNYAWKKRDYGLRTLFIALTDNQDDSERHMPRVAKAVRLKSVMGVSVDGIEGPGAYGLNKKVTLTVVVAKGNKVTANFALLSPNGTDAPKIIRELDRILPQKPIEPKLDTSEDMKKEILRLRREIRMLRNEMEQLRNQMNRRNRRGMERKPKRKLPGKAPEDPELVSFIRQLIQKTNENADVDRIIKEIEEYASKDAALRKQVIEAEKLLAHLKYGTDYARAQLKALRGKLEKKKEEPKK